MIDPDTDKRIVFNGSKGVVLWKNQIFVFRRDGNTNRYPYCLDLLGGGRDDQETPFETFSREAKEELNISITRSDIMFSSRHKSSVDPTTISFFFVAEITDLDITTVALGDEGTEWLLIDPADFVSRKDGVPGQQQRVKEYFQEYKTELI